MPLTFTCYEHASTCSLTREQQQQQKSDAQRRSKRRKAKGLFNRWKRLSLKHTWLSPMVLILALLACYYISPGEHNPLYPAIHLSYANPPMNERTNTLPPHIGDVTQYGKGKKDFAFVAFYIIVFTFTREFLMQRLILPIAKSYGIKSRAKQYRFMEQFYTAIYFAIFGPFGLWVMSRTPVWYFNTAGMYEGFPHRAHEGWFKAYYLLQASYWAQQAVVLMLQLEAPRKDFKELVLHHVVTLALIGLSYRFHFTYMGIAVYITHDISDFFLAVSVNPLERESTHKANDCCRHPKSSTTSTSGGDQVTSPASSSSGHTRATTSIYASSGLCCQTANSQLSGLTSSTGTRSSTNAGSLNPSLRPCSRSCRRSTSSGLC